MHRIECPLQMHLPMQYQVNVRQGIVCSSVESTGIFAAVGRVSWDFSAVSTSLVHRAATHTNVR